jgi:1-acyl-sn-glycerol-3-phosphate acyltransferase
MAKRVLGNDPFADGKKDEAASKRDSAPSKSGTSKRPSTTPAKSAANQGGGSKSVAPKARNARPPSMKPASAQSSSRPSAMPSSRPSKPSKGPTGKTAAITSGAGDPVRPVRAPAHLDAIVEGATSPQSILTDIDPDRVVPQPPPPTFEIEPPTTIDDESIGAADLPPNLQRAPAWSAPPSAPETPRATEHVDVKADIRTIEAEIDRLLDSVSDRGADRETLDRVAARLREKMGTDRTPSEPAENAVDAAREDVFDVARELLSSDYYRRQWGRVAMRDRSEEVDDFGLDPKYAARVRPFFDFLYERWWRVEAHDIDRVPGEGRVILCTNHSGALPYDGAMLATALRREHPQRRDLRWLAEDFIFHFPFLGVFMNRIGAVRACQENAERLLRKEACVGVFPEGVKGIAKLYRDRYKLQRFGRGGHVKLAIRTRTPIVPVAILGAEEAHPLIAPTSILAKALGVPFVPITPTFPWLGPLGLVPMPSKWKIFFLEPITMDAYPPDAADDEVLVGRLNEKIRGLIQEELDRAVKSRASVMGG